MANVSVHKSSWESRHLCDLPTETGFKPSLTSTPSKTQNSSLNSSWGSTWGSLHLSDLHVSISYDSNIQVLDGGDLPTDSGSTWELDTNSISTVSPNSQSRSPSKEPPKKKICLGGPPPPTYSDDSDLPDI